MKFSFKVTASGAGANLVMDIKVEAVGDGEQDNVVRATKNVIFDMLRSQDFDVDKIVFSDEMIGVG